MDDAIAWIVGLSVIFVLTVLVVWFANKVGLRRQVLVAAFVFISMSLLFKSIFGLAGDENAYQLEALGILSQWNNGDTHIPVQPWTKLSLSYLLAAIYFVSLPSIYLGVLLLTPLFCALPVLIGQSSLNFFGGVRIQQFSAWIAVFFPPFLVWFPALLRESLSFFLLALGLYGSSLMYRNRVLISVAVTGLSLILMMYVRVQLTWSLVIMFLASTLMLAFTHQIHIRRALSLALSMMTVVLIFIGTQLMTDDITPNLLTSDSVITNSDLRRQIITSNASPSENLAADVDLIQEPGITAAVLDTGRNLFPSLIGPFPWQWKSFSHVMAGLDGLILLVVISLSLLPLFVKGIHGTMVSLILLLSALPIILGNSLGFANYGIAMRLRSNVALILLPIAAYSALQIYTALRRKRGIKMINRAAKFEHKIGNS